MSETHNNLSVIKEICNIFFGEDRSIDIESHINDSADRMVDKNYDLKPLSKDETPKSADDLFANLVLQLKELENLVLRMKELERKLNEIERKVKAMLGE